MGSAEASMAACPPSSNCLRKARIAQLRAIDELSGQLGRRFLTQHLLHERIVRPKRLPQLRQREGQRQLLKLGIDRLIRERAIAAGSGNSHPYIPAASFASGLAFSSG